MTAQARMAQRLRDLREADTLGDELLALGADMGRMSPAARRATELGLKALNGDGRPREAAGAHTHEGGTPREHGRRY